MLEPSRVKLHGHYNVGIAELKQDARGILFVRPLLDIDDYGSFEVIDAIGHDLSKPVACSGPNRLALHVVGVIQVVAVMREDAFDEIVVIWPYAQVVGGLACVSDELNRADSNAFHFSLAAGRPCICPWQKRQTVIRFDMSRFSFW